MERKPARMHSILLAILSLSLSPGYNKNILSLYKIKEMWRNLRMVHCREWVFSVCFCVFRRWELNFSQSNIHTSAHVLIMNSGNRRQTVAMQLNKRFPLSQKWVIKTRALRLTLPIFFKTKSVFMICKKCPRIFIWINIKTSSMSLEISDNVECEHYRERFSQTPLQKNELLHN